MKLILLIAICIGVAAAQDGHAVNGEVTAIIADDPNISVGQCAAKCDAIFDNLSPDDETALTRPVTKSVNAESTTTAE